MILSRINIGNKLALIMIGLSLAVIALLSTLFLAQFESALKERIFLQLSSVKQLKIAKLKTELNDRLTAFEKVLQKPLDSRPSGYFFHLQAYQTIPDIIDGFTLSVRVGQPQNVIGVIDVTPQDINREITLAFISKVSDQYLIGITEVPEMQNILLERTGLGQTGESYIVGSDYRLRTRSRFKLENPRAIEVKTDGVTKAFGGQSGEAVFTDYRGKEVFSSFEKLTFNGLEWVILSEIDYQEALFPLNKLKKKLIYILLIILPFILLVSYFLSRMIVRPVLSMEKKLIAMSKGILDGVSTKIERNDEIGRMFEALNKLVKAMSETIIFAGKIGSGNFNANYETLSPDNKLGEALIQMQQKLKEYQETEKRLLKENQQSILDGEERERSRLSKEMHDGLGPMLTTLRINIQSAEISSDAKKLLLERLDETIKEVRRISNNLMPSVLSDFGAGEAIGNLIDQVKENNEISFRYKNDMPVETEIDDNIQITLYRIAQESINNAIKHSRANEIKISVTAFEDHISYYISDDGIGFDVDRLTSGNGVRNMRERVKLANGTINIESNEDGTTIEVEVPIK